MFVFKVPHVCQFYHPLFNSYYTCNFSHVFVPTCSDIFRSFCSTCPKIISQDQRLCFSPILFRLSRLFQTFPGNIDVLYNYVYIYIWYRPKKKPMQTLILLVFTVNFIYFGTDFVAIKFEARTVGKQKN